MEYQVPQFVEVESKIVGPLSLKQFIYIAGGIGLCVALLRYLPIFVALLLCIPVAGLSGSLAFYKINNKPFINIIEAGARFYTSSKLFIWKKDFPVQKEELPQKISESQQTITMRNDKHLTRSGIQKLAKSFDNRKNTTNNLPPKAI
ncbi:MAG TPA: PrgI family protein [Candidatus Kaiserbacteria bacterium]|nr:PrgI family protein [Candidatus Kaiserbacteria bacterium]